MVVSDFGKTMNKRMIDCNFVNASSFQKLPNKSKLLYLMMISNADDKGFVDNSNDIIDKLTFSEDSLGNTNLTLLNNDYISALLTLVERGLLYEFRDNHNNSIYLIRHWWIHNRLVKGLWTNYARFYAQVEIIDNEYVLKGKETIIKEDYNKVNQSKVNNYPNNDNETDTNKKEDKEWDNLMEQLTEGVGKNDD